LVKKKVKAIIKILKSPSKYDNHERHFINRINTLREYKKHMKNINGQIKQEYKEVSNFLNYYKNIEEQ